jgi:hypothetical protein
MSTNATEVNHALYARLLNGLYIVMADSAPMRH